MTLSREILEDANTILWENYGRELLYKNCNPQVLSYNTCVEEGFKAIFESHKVVTFSKCCDLLNL